MQRSLQGRFSGLSDLRERGRAGGQINAFFGSFAGAIGRVRGSAQMPKSASAESLDVARFLLEAGGRDSQSKATKVFARQERLAKNPRPGMRKVSKKCLSHRN